MRTFVIAAVVLSSSVALAELPTREQFSLAKDLKRTVDGLLVRIRKLDERFTTTEAQIAKAGVRISRRHAWDKPIEDRPPTAAEMAAIDPEIAALESEATQLESACTAYEGRVAKLGLPYSLDMMESNCNAYFGSLHQKADCTQWRQLRVGLWPQRGRCADTAKNVQSALEGFHRYRKEWETAQQKEAARQAEDAVISQAVSGNPHQRAVPVPRQFVTTKDDKLITDTRGLFAATHPSHFVFLRKDLAGAPRASGESEAGFSRKLKKGEAVIPIRSHMASSTSVQILSIDGNRGVVRSEDLAAAPLPKTKVAPLTAADLNAIDARETQWPPCGVHDDRSLLTRRRVCAARESGSSSAIPRWWTVSRRRSYIHTHSRPELVEFPEDDARATERLRPLDAGSRGKDSMRPLTKRRDQHCFDRRAEGSFPPAHSVAHIESKSSSDERRQG